MPTTMQPARRASFRPTTPEATPRLIAERVPGQEYWVEDNGDNFVFLTNADGAEDFKPHARADRAARFEHWEELVAHEPGRLILDHVEFADFRVRMERADALPRIVITDKRSAPTEHAIGFAAEAYSSASRPATSTTRPRCAFIYSAPDTPDETFDYDMATRARVLRKRRQVPSGFDPDAISCAG